MKYIMALLLLSGCVHTQYQTDPIAPEIAKRVMVAEGMCPKHVAGGLSYDKDCKPYIDKK